MAKAQNALLLQALGLGTHLVPLITHAKQNNLRRPSRTWLMLRILMSILKHECSKEMAHGARKSMGVGANKHHAQPIATQQHCDDSTRWWYEMVL